MLITKEMQEQGSEVIESLFNEVRGNAAFKAEFLKSPREVLEKFTGKKLDLPENITLVAEDQSDPSVVYLNIPKKLDLSNFELTDEQLELVAGGEIGITGCILIGLGCAAVGVGVGYLAAKALQ